MRLNITAYAPQDSETGDRYLSSPISGTSYILRGGRPLGFGLRCALWLDGLRGYRKETLDPLGEDSNFTPTCPYLPVLSTEEARLFDNTWEKLETDIESVPLVRIARCIAAAPAGGNDRQIDEALHLAHSLREKTRTNCLLHSFWQAYVLHYFKVPCTLYIGVWMPINEAHAWLMAAAPDNTERNIVIGDHADRVMHYAPTLTFKFA